MRRATLRPFASLLVALVLAAPLGAILVRPDREDARYLKLAEKYPSSCLIGIPDGEGTLIEPRWVLTAAHIAKEVEKADPKPAIDFGGKTYKVVTVVIHPDFKPKTPNDIALLKLERAVTGVEPTPIYRGTEEKGKEAVIVGHGYTGDLKAGHSGKEKWDKKKRAATNVISDVRKTFFVMAIEPPPKATDLQGAAGPGDSGGPAFIEVEKKLFVAGVGVATDDANADKVVGNYGDRELYVRVSAFAQWIDDTIKANAD